MATILFSHTPIHIPAASFTVSVLRNNSFDKSKRFSY
nr:MAG TPA: hypothetical protein [Caudoviricetes sp.]